MGIYDRLFTYRERPSNSPLENFLTEALTDLFNRLPLPIRIEFLAQMLPASSTNRFRTLCKDGKQIEAVSQESIAAAGSVKRPDIVVYLEGNPIALFEVKVEASLQVHTYADIERPLPHAGTQLVDQDQLKTYSDWIRAQCPGDWPGAVIFLTHGTRAPSGFENDGRRGRSAIGVTRTWKDVGLWLADNPELKHSDTTHCALASDFVDFLERQGLMAGFMNFRDVAATALFIPTYATLSHTFRTVITEVSVKYPKSRGGNVHVEFWADGSAYLGWYYLNKALNPVSSKFWIAVGICFPVREKNALFGADPVGMPKHEPFFFVSIADDWGNKKPWELLRKIPEGWVEVNEGHCAAITRPVSRFEEDPDARAQSLIRWAQEEAGRALTGIPNYEAAAVEAIAADEES